MNTYTYTFILRYYKRLFKTDATLLLHMYIHVYIYNCIDTYIHTNKCFRFYA
jgi:hypothetical protein